MGEPDRRSCLYRILPQTTGRSNCVLKTHPRAQTLAAFDPRNSPGQGERRQSLPGPHSRSCLFPTEGQVGGICSLTFSSATLVSLKAPESSRTPLPRIHTPLLPHHLIPHPPSPVLDLLQPELGEQEHGGKGSGAGDPGDGGAAASPHQAASDPTGHSEGTPTAPLESPHADPTLFSRLLSHPSRLLPSHPSRFWNVSLSSLPDRLFSAPLFPREMR